MFEHAAMNAEFRDIEQMVRAAGDYLEITDDLRPQTLEQARDETRKTATRSWIAVIAVSVVFFAVSAGVYSGRPTSKPTLMAHARADGDPLYAAARQKAAQATVDPSWSLVDAFSELRRRQAGLIRDAL